MKIDICFSPTLYPYYEGDSDTIVVVTDIFRATTTMCAALKNGASSIIPVESLEEAQEYKKKGYLVGGERNVKRCDFADFGNSPFEYTADKVEGKDVVLSTTNGTRAIETASGAYSLIIGAFSNIDVVADYCIANNKNVLVLCSGWENRFNFEDTLFGGALASILSTRGGYEAKSDSAVVALSMWNSAKSDVQGYVSQSEHYGRLIANNLLEDIVYCLTLNTLDLLPIYNKETKKIKIK